MEMLRGSLCCGKIHLSELFPTKWSAFIFVAYMACFINQGLLVTASQHADNSYHYNTIMAVLATEVTKLIVSFILYIKDHRVFELLQSSKTHINVMYKYFVPATLYCLYNNLAFINLSTFDPTTYFLLLQLRVVITGVLFQVLFSKKLSSRQWLSLVLLTAGCMIKQLPFSEHTDASPTESEIDAEPQPLHKGTSSILSFSMLLIIVQVVCSCLAGVYNELLLKSTETEKCNIYIQNIFMYLDSILCNIVLLFWGGQLSVLWDWNEISFLLEFKVLLVILNNAAIGIVTSFFLRSLNSILKTFASALELIFTAILTRILFDIPIHANTFCAILVVSIAVIMYSQNPVVNVKTSQQDSKELVSLV